MADWTNQEVELIIADYFAMLKEELNGRIVNKTLHRKNLIHLLNSRSEGSIEFKHQNISAVLIKFGSPYIRGYKPRWNYQGILEEKVSEYLNKKPSLEKDFIMFSDNVVLEKEKIKKVVFENIVESAPKTNWTVKEDKIPYNVSIKINYLEREQRNRTLGELGEELVVNYERWRLIDAGKASLSETIEWISKSKGDGAGFDILSKNTNGTDRYIEVKTTKLRKETPIFFSKNEYLFSKKNSSNFHLYRVFNFNESPKIFLKQGQFDTFCRVEAQTFKGYF